MSAEEYAKVVREASARADQQPAWKRRVFEAWYAQGWTGGARPAPGTGTAAASIVLPAAKAKGAT